MLPPFRFVKSAVVHMPSKYHKKWFIYAHSELHPDKIIHVVDMNLTYAKAHDKARLLQAEMDRIVDERNKLQAEIDSSIKLICEAGGDDKMVKLITAALCRKYEKQHNIPKLSRNLYAPATLTRILYQVAW